MRKRSRVSLPIRPIIVDFDSFVAVTVTLAMAASTHEAAVVMDLAGHEAGRHELMVGPSTSQCRALLGTRFGWRVGHKANIISAL